MALLTINAGDPGIPANVNQYKDLLTGTTLDQAVSLRSRILLKARNAAPGAATATVGAGGSVTAGLHNYAVTFGDNESGETALGTSVAATTSGGNLTVNLTSIPTGPTGTTYRNIYRTKVGAPSVYYYVHTIADNSTTSYSDTVADSSISLGSPAHPNFGGNLVIQDSTGTVKAQIFSDGAFSFDAGAFTSDGFGDLTANFLQVNGTGNGLYVVHNVYVQGSTSLDNANITTDGSGNLTVGGNVNSNGKHVPYLVPTGGSTAGRQIFTGTSTPSGANEGDIWIKA